MITAEEAWKIYREADLVCPAEEVQTALKRLSQEITAELGDQNPLILSVITSFSKEKRSSTFSSVRLRPIKSRKHTR